ncbi:MAG TPA: ABC transporter ATP-binding protein [Candidatus Scatomorpha merdigallinarum]|nr:ABC transporter ATP-binding protein [Candidatus Scatomorpha merdigallinarum]
MFEIKNVSKQYGSRQALKNVSLSLPRGELVGLFGENGAGKSTLMKCMLGFVRYTGHITLDGEPVTTKNIERIAFATSEHSFFPDLSPEGHAQFYSDHFPKFNRRRFEVLMDFFGLPMHGAARRLSTGQKNQFEVVLALSQGADYILMDEPFAGNDIFNREDFYKVLLGILGENETVLLSTHLIEEVAGFIGRAVLIHQGEITGDVYMSELEERGESLVDYVKNAWNYRADRIARAINELDTE